jgi:hypothetical protein
MTVWLKKGASSESHVLSLFSMYLASTPPHLDSHTYVWGLNNKETV